MVILSRENAIPAGDSVAIISIKTFIGSFVRVGIFILAILWVFIAKPDWGLSTGANILVNVGLMITLALFVLLLITIMKPEFAEFLAKRILNSKFLSKLLSQNARQKALDWVGKTVKEFSSAKDKVFSEFKRNKVYFTFAFEFYLLGLCVVHAICAYERTWCNITMATGADYNDYILYLICILSHSRWKRYSRD